MNYVNISKKEEGITLVALIITVILMLIIAGVAISSLINDGRLFGKTRNIAISYKDSSKIEKNIIDELLGKSNLSLGNEINFPLTEAGIYKMIVNAGKSAMWLGVDLKDANIPEGASINIKYLTSDDLKTWDEEKTDIFKVRNSQYLRVIIELIPNENGNVPTISSAKVRFKTEIEEFEEIELENMTQQENGWVALNESLAIGATGTITQVKELTAEDKEKGLGLSLGIGGSSSVESGNGVETGGLSLSGNGTGYSTIYYKSTDGVSWTEVNSLSSTEIADATYVKAVTTLEKSDTEIVIGPLVQNTEGVSGTIEKVTEWIDIKKEYYDFDANSVGNWIELISDETLPEGTRIKYYFSKSNDESSWTEYNEDITANGSSRYLKLKVVYQKENDSIINTPLLNDFYINYNVEDSENPGKYINKTVKRGEGEKFPSITKMSVSDITPNSFLLTVTAENDVDIKKYEFYIDDMQTPYKVVESENTTETCEVTGRTMGTVYNCKVIVYDVDKNYIESEIIQVKTFEILNYSTKSNYTYTLKSSGNVDSARKPEKVFDNSTNIYSGCWHSPNASNQWLEIAFEEERKVAGFTLQNRAHFSSDYNIRKFYFQASKDETTWITLQEYTNPSGASVKTGYDVSYEYVDGGYKYYRWYAPYTGYVVIGELTIELI